MLKNSVMNASDALVYITDCTLATASYMASMKSKSAREYRRQQAIAQQAIDWMNEYGVDYGGTRADDVKKAGSVEAWCRWFEQ